MPVEDVHSNPSSNADSRDLWVEILREASSSGQTTFQERHLMVLNSYEPRLQELFGKIKGPSNTSTGFQPENKWTGLHYTHVLMADEDNDDSLSPLNVWFVEDHFGYQHLFPLALNEENFSTSAVVFPIDLSKPWEIMKNLEEKLSLLEDYILECGLPQTGVEQNRRSLQAYIHEFIESDETPYCGPSTENLEKLESHTGGPVITRNLGIPVIFLGYNSDELDTMERDGDLKEAEVDYIQYCLRQKAIHYGATLIYTSCKDNKNVSTFKKYISHRLYGLPLTVKGNALDRSTIFIPSGWDTNGKIATLEQSISSLHLDAVYDDIIRKPISRRVASSISTAPIRAEDDQKFLSKQQETLSKSFDKANSAPRNNSSGLVIGKGNPNVEATLDKKKRVSSGPLQSPSADVSSTTSSPVSSSGKPNEGVLADFFNSLLQKKTGPSSGQSGPSPAESLSALSDKDSGDLIDRTQIRKGVAAELDRIKKSHR
eukprot:Sdes_comp21911_c0_seq1m20449